MNKNIKISIWIIVFTIIYAHLVVLLPISDWCNLSDKRNQLFIVFSTTMIIGGIACAVFVASEKPFKN